MQNLKKPKKYLRICLLSYRSNPHCGGQGVYIKNISRALKDIGHNVEVVSGPPYPELDSDILLHSLENLDLYNPDDLFRTPRIDELKKFPNLIEWLDVCTMGYPEPLTFGMRAINFIKRNKKQYDIVHDNQCLSYGIQKISRHIPLVATIHHPMTVDRNLAVRSAPNFFRKLQQLRWYSFVGMQKRVAKNISKIITVSNCSANDISKAYNININRFRIVPNGIDITKFYPISRIKRIPYRIITTNSADTPLKGLIYLLQAVSSIRKKRKIELYVVGSPKKNGIVEKMVSKLNLKNNVIFLGRISNSEFVTQYAKAGIAVIPSLYEGFGLPAGEAMACAIPVISTTGGALPEVVGDAGILVPPKNAYALEKAILHIFDNPQKAEILGKKGLQRVHKFFTWENAAKKTVDIYREVLLG